MIRSIVWQKENDKNQAFQFLLRFSSRNVNTWLKMLVSLFFWKSLETLVVREFVQVSKYLFTIKSNGQPHIHNYCSSKFLNLFSPQLLNNVSIVQLF